jgi:outer membrane lipoprotein LolB
VKRALRVAVGVLAVALAGCASTGHRGERPGSTLPSDALAAQRNALTHWQLDGRIAVSDGKEGGSGRIAWRQRDETFEITVRAPISNDTWRLAGDASGAQFDGAGGKSVRGDDAEALLARELGWRLPVAAAKDWIVGLPHDARLARIDYDADGNPRVLREGGWTVEFRAWLPAQDGRPAMPRRLVAKRPPYEVRLAIADWRVDAP